MGVVAEIAGAVGCGGGVEGTLTSQTSSKRVASAAWVLADQALICDSRGSSDQTVAFLTNTAGIISTAELAILDLAEEALPKIIDLKSRSTVSAEVSKDAGIAVGNPTVQALRHASR